MILALDLYLRRGNIDDRDPEVVEMSRLLNALWAGEREADGETFRNPNGVALKLANFAALDPGHEGAGMTRGGKGDRDVWDAFSKQPARLAELAAAIREGVGEVEPGDLGAEDAGAEEGGLLVGIHSRRERDAGLARKKKAAVDKATGALACEVCGFDFAATYGALGEGFAECHHVRPLHTLPTKRRTSLADLAIVCANCHRMLHRVKPFGTLESLRTVLAAR